MFCKPSVVIAPVSHSFEGQCLLFRDYFLFLFIHSIIQLEVTNFKKLQQVTNKNFDG